jgi:electron transfer flavoprotein alpha subunit
MPPRAADRPPVPLVVVAETADEALTPPTLECVEEARDIADALGAEVHVVLPGSSVAPLAETLAAHGADRVTVIEHEALALFSADGWLAAVAPVLEEARPVFTLAPDSGFGRSWLPRLSARWRVPLATDCLRVKATDEGYPEVYRMTHGGRLHERLIWARGTPLMAMLAAGVRGVGPARAGRPAAVIQVRPKLQPRSFRDRTLRTHPADPQDVDLSEADRIVAGGFGVGDAGGMALVQQLADALNAALGGTRVVADRGWIGHDRYIGTTGKIVQPKLYMALGVSGAGQHVAGIGGSEVIIAVNTDRTAPMLKLADLAVVGDLNEIVPLLIEKLKAHASGGDARAAAERRPSLIREATG